MENTLLLVKPDGVQRRLVGEILRRFEVKGLQIVALKLMMIPKETAERHYAAHKGKPFHPGLLSYMTSGPVVALVARGRNAVHAAGTLVSPSPGFKVARMISSTSRTGPRCRPSTSTPPCTTC